MITVKLDSIKAILKRWKIILFIGGPLAITKLITPLGIGILNKFMSLFGQKAVASIGPALRVEFFSLSVIYALSSVLGPFVGQNWGAKKFDRIKRGIKGSIIFSIFWGIITVAFLNIFSKPIASLFSLDIDVINVIVYYLRIVSIGYSFFGILLISSSVLIVIKKPFHASALLIFQMFIIFVPIAILGIYLFKIYGVFISLALSYVLVGIIALFLQKYYIKKLSQAA